ncbi:hypothetical protein DPMN_064336 [Dreissena polymorpha]|uniref:Uncharacterized protein n=1 Tax=Dreissena polymorpha TaxID=45954 RepID=A0A9D4HL24_DREPO|nr:hypothetical protein DPMN_064336 [Dreissena polymorpha]
MSERREEWRELVARSPVVPLSSRLRPCERVIVRQNPSRKEESSTFQERNAFFNVLLSTQSSEQEVIHCMLITCAGGKRNQTDYGLKFNL